MRLQGLERLLALADQDARGEGGGGGGAAGEQAAEAGGSGALAALQAARTAELEATNKDLKLQVGPGARGGGGQGGGMQRLSLCNLQAAIHEIAALLAWDCRRRRRQHR